MQDHTPHKHEQVKPHEKPEHTAFGNYEVDGDDDDLTGVTPEVTPNAAPGDGGDSGPTSPAPPPPPVKG